MLLIIYIYFRNNKEHLINNVFSHIVHLLNSFFKIFRNKYHFYYFFYFYYRMQSYFKETYY